MDCTATEPRPILSWANVLVLFKLDGDGNMSIDSEGRKADAKIKGKKLVKVWKA